MGIKIIHSVQTFLNISAFSPLRPTEMSKMCQTKAEFNFCMLRDKLQLYLVLHTYAGTGRRVSGKVDVSTSAIEIQFLVARQVAI